MAPNRPAPMIPWNKLAQWQSADRFSIGAVPFLFRVPSIFSPSVSIRSIAAGKRGRGIITNPLQIDEMRALGITRPQGERTGKSGKPKRNETHIEMPGTSETSRVPSRIRVRTPGSPAFFYRGPPHLPAVDRELPWLTCRHSTNQGLPALPASCACLPGLVGG